MNPRVTLTLLVFTSCAAQIEEPPPAAHDAVRPHVAEPIGAPIRIPTAIEKPAIVAKQRLAPLGHVEIAWEDEGLGTRFAVKATSCTGFEGPWAGTVVATGAYTGSSKAGWTGDTVEIALPVKGESMEGDVKGTLSATPSSAGDTHQIRLTGTLRVETTSGTIHLPKIDQFLDVKPVPTPCPGGAR